MHRRFLAQLLCASPLFSGAFAPPPPPSPVLSVPHRQVDSSLTPLRPHRPVRAVAAGSSSSVRRKPTCVVVSLRDALSASERDWSDLSDDGSLRKRILTPGNGPTPEPGAKVSVDYVGRIHSNGEDWTVGDVLECWLSEQQGMDDLADAFVEVGLDGQKLLGGSFDEDFVETKLGVANAIKRKKLVMAARRLSKQRSDHPPETKFDSSEERGPYTFVLGKGKAIQAYEMAIPMMQLGERAEIICRSDLAYGKEGFRRGDGTIVVPPFASLRFEVTLVSVGDDE